MEFSDPPTTWTSNQMGKTNSKTMQRSLKLLRGRGAYPYKSESYNAFTHMSSDLYGWIDLTALEPGVTGVLGVQTTTGTHIQARIRKAEKLRGYRMWLAQGNDAEFHGWRKIKAGRAVATWQPTIIRVTMKDLFS